MELRLNLLHPRFENMEFVQKILYSFLNMDQEQSSHCGTPKSTSSEGSRDVHYAPIFTAAHLPSTRSLNAQSVGPMTTRYPHICDIYHQEI